MRINLSKEEYALLLKKAGYTKYITVDVLDEENANTEQQVIENPESPTDSVKKVLYGMLDKMVSDYNRNKLRSN